MSTTSFAPSASSGSRSEETAAPDHRQLPQPARRHARRDRAHARARGQRRPGGGARSRSVARAVLDQAVALSGSRGPHGRSGGSRWWWPLQVGRRAVVRQRWDRGRVGARVAAILVRARNSADPGLFGRRSGEVTERREALRWTIAIEATRRKLRGKPPRARTKSPTLHHRLRHERVELAS